jgi:hypothetical protein
MSYDDIKSVLMSYDDIKSVLMSYDDIKSVLRSYDCVENHKLRPRPPKISDYVQSIVQSATVVKGHCKSLYEYSSLSVIYTFCHTSVSLIFITLY